MDDIYGDLENYNDINAVKELRSENRDLRLKIQEYATAMDKLQKDFDELATEFKKLEMNYSSLLKTARTEIERKTQIITNLNLEKDKLVLNVIQNKGVGDARRVINRSRFEAQKHNDPRQRKKDNSDLKNRKPSENQLQDARSKITGKRDVGETNSESKENTVSQVLPGSKPNRLTNRRKSVPALRYAGSEDEFDLLSNPFVNRNNQTRQETHRQSRPLHKGSRGSESSADEKYSSYKESSLETYYKAKGNRFYESDYGNKSRHSYTERHQNYSPERLLRKATRNLAAYQHHDPRPIENPDSNKYGHRSRSRDRRTYYDNNYKDYQERYNYGDRNPGKHKMEHDYQDMSSKRIKQTHSRYPEKNDWQHEKYTDEELLQKVIGDIQYTSCQSPDINSDHSTQPITEIKLIADGPLPDPRLKSRKYSLNTNEGKDYLSTVKSNKLDLKPINKSLWKIETVKVPEALQHPPEIQEPSDHISVSHVNQLTDDKVIDNSEILEKDVSNITDDKIKRNDTADHVLTQATSMATDENLNLNASTKPLPKYKIPKVKKHENKDKKYISSAQETNHNPVCKQKVITETSKINNNLESLTCSIYDNINTPNENMSTEEGELDDLDDLILTGLTSTKPVSNQTKTKNIETTASESEHNILKLKLSKDNEQSYHVSCESINLDDTNKKWSQPKSIKDDTTIKKDAQKSQEKFKSNTECKRKLTSKEIVAGDLELSDETNDDHEVQHHFTEKPKEPIHETKVSNTIKLDSETVSIPEIDIKIVRMETPEEDTHIKRRGRAKKTKLPTKQMPKLEKTVEKKTRQKKVKEAISTPIKNKFSDLFGDSSSLITPEDLGLGAIQVTSQYDQIIEDAQDALDVKLDNNKPANLEVENTSKVIEETVPPKHGDKSNVQNKILDSELIENVPNVDEVCNTNILQPSITKLHTDEAVEGETNAITCPITVPVLQVEEPGVEKTIIISTGIQPQFLTESTSETPIDVASHKILNQAKVVADKNSLIALATSTPHKSKIEPVLNLPDVCSNSNDSSKSCSNSLTVPENSLPPEIAAEDDIPDVRIILKRKKRRVIKKP